VNLLRDLSVEGVSKHLHTLEGTVSEKVDAADISNVELASLPTQAVNMVEGTTCTCN
jgi:hypothetical protein